MVKVPYLDWDIQFANEIYPVVEISYVGHKLQMMALLTFLEKERRNNAMVNTSSSGTRGKWEMRSLECSVNYDARSVSPSRGIRKGRGNVVDL
jgi:hypothetical protein